MLLNLMSRPSITFKTRLYNRIYLSFDTKRLVFFHLHACIFVYVVQTFPFLRVAKGVRM